MRELDPIFRERLLEIEKLNPAYRQEYERQVKAMVEKKLTGWAKLSHIVGLIMGLGFAGLFGTLAVIVPTEFPLWGRAMWALGAVFGLVIAFMSAWTLKKGTINLKDDEMASAGLGWAFIVIVGTIALVFSGTLPDPIKGVHMLVYLLFFLVMAAVGLIKAFIKRSELNTREKLLEIEYRLAELAEQVKSKQSQVDDGGPLNRK
jgi:hypothetical protein